MKLEFMLILLFHRLKFLYKNVSSSFIRCYRIVVLQKTWLNFHCRFFFRFVLFCLVYIVFVERIIWLNKWKTKSKQINKQQKAKNKTIILLWIVTCYTVKMLNSKLIYSNAKSNIALEVRPTQHNEFDAFEWHGRCSCVWMRATKWHCECFVVVSTEQSERTKSIVF